MNCAHCGKEFGQGQLAHYSGLGWLCTSCAEHLNTPWLNVKEAAAYLRIGLTSMRELYQKRIIPYYKPIGEYGERSGRIIFKREDLDIYMEKHRIEEIPE